MKKPISSLFFKGIFLTAVLTFVLVFAPLQTVAAAADTIGGPTTVIGKVLDKVAKKLETAYNNVSSSIFQTTITNALKKVAYDTATWIGSGDNGQKPLFLTKDASKYLGELADSAAGEFIDAFSQAAGVNFCAPDLNVKIKIGLGLNDAYATRPPDSKCKASTMFKAWKTDINSKMEAIKDPGYLKNISTMFDVRGNDVSIALTTLDGLNAAVNKKTEEVKTDLGVGGGWLSKKNVGGKVTEPPGTAERALTSAANNTAEAQKVSATKSVLTDVSKVFLNTLATTAFNKALRNIASGDLSALTYGLIGNKTDAEIIANITNGGPANTARTNPGCLGDPNCDPSVQYGESAVKAQLADMAKQAFDTRGDYDILGELSVCTDPNKPGPTECILDDKFSSAISDQKTVIEAVKDGSLNKGWRLKRDVDFNSGYSLRSLLVLRKFRIIPVGWETALLRAEENSKSVTLMDMVSCFDPNDNYSEFSQGFTPAAWCQGLIDPNWVLKAPLNYCKREGYSSQILDKNIIAANTDAGTEEQIILTRADNYCADEQSCIKEKTDGTCEAYGYCTEEKRTWDFASDSCDATYNTCQSFVKSNGSGVAYLENTINYATCNADNAGCRPYSTSGSYISTSDSIAWNSLGHVYFSKNVESCDSSQEGCNELIRTVPEAGHNFLINSDFEESLDLGSWDVGAGGMNNVTTTPDGYFSNTSLKTLGSFSKSVAVGPNDYDISGRSYTFSFYAKNCVTGDQAVFGSNNVDNKSVSLNAGSDWGYYVVNYNFPLGLTGNQLYFSFAASANCQIDRLKLELSKVGTAYSNYYQSNLVYQKLIPNYLASACYVDPNSTSPDYTLKSNAPAKCSNYTRRCNASEVDCELYKSVRDDFVLPAKTTPFDSCLAECDGYDSYIQKETSFQTPSAASFIPTTATKCSVDAVGCTEFTNLDAVAQGGEGKEYYSFLRQCIKPDDSKCGIFYSWGSAGSSYDLQPYKLQAASSVPVLTVGSFDTIRNQVDTDGKILCSEAIFNAAPSSADYNPDCRQLYNKAGLIYYALYNNTVTCSDECHPYRISETPIDESITDAGACSGADKSWNASSSACFVCKNGGTWDDNQKACVYQAIPGEGKTCNATENGCREYNGNYGNNLKIVSTYDFENNKKWASFNTDSSSLSSDSINKGGHSLKYEIGNGSSTDNFILTPQTALLNSPNKNKINVFSALKNLWGKLINGAEAQSTTALPNTGIGVTVGTSVKQNSSYVVRFLAKSSSNVSVKVYLTNGTVANQFNGTAVAVSGNNEWKMYSLNLGSLSHEVTDKEALLISASGSLLLDNITLTEITDRFYLIKNSWTTPDSCYYDTFGEYQGANYNLGCSAYTNRANQTSYLRNFSSLCQDSSVGCELMTLTNNSASPVAQAFGESGTPDNKCDSSDGASCVAVPADKMVYVVYDENKQCGSENKGCSRLGGQTVTNQDVTTQNLYADVYIKNNPDKYSSTLCQESEVGCDEWKSLSGQSSYFKDPGNNVCEWRKPKNVTGLNLLEKWYKKAVMRCDFDKNGKINNINGVITESQNRLCSTSADCGTGNCILDENNYLCDVDSLKTIGLGGGNLVYQPKNMVGTCAAEASGCTEYIDPVSEFSPSIITNPTLDDVDGNGVTGDSWSVATQAQDSTTFAGQQKQAIYLSQNKLYSFSVKVPAATAVDTTLRCSSPVRVLSGDNTFSVPTNSIVISKTEQNKNILFNSLNNVTCTIYGGEAGLNKIIGVRGVILDYKLASTVDKTSCNGSVSFDAGCILFNERKVATNQDGSKGLSSLQWNAYNGSYVSGSPVGDTTSGDSNVLIKVKPNRACSKWLSCLSYRKDSNGEKICSILGECDKLGSDGVCQNIVAKKAEAQHTFDSGLDKNITGYSKMDSYYLANMGETTEDPAKNWGFEDSASSEGVTIITNSGGLGIDTGTISYPVVGKGIAKITGSVTLPGSISVRAGRPYFINFLININATGGKGGTLEVVGSGATSTSIASGIGWQRKILPFYPTADGSVFIKLNQNGQGTVYFDDINVEPVLEIADNVYAAKECRLYPKQDSLSCKSDNLSEAADGLYGYCLEHDPKNSDVCLMWFPIDTIKSSQAAAAVTTGWNGIGNNTISPYYCAQISPDFNFVTTADAASNSGSGVANGACSQTGFQRVLTNDEAAGLSTELKNIINTINSSHPCKANSSLYQLTYNITYCLNKCSQKCVSQYYCIPKGSTGLNVCDPYAVDEPSTPTLENGCRKGSCSWVLSNGTVPSPFSSVGYTPICLNGDEQNGNSDNGKYRDYYPYITFNKPTYYRSPGYTELIRDASGAILSAGDYKAQCAISVQGDGSSGPWAARLNGGDNISGFPAGQGDSLSPFGSQTNFPALSGVPYSCFGTMCSYVNRSGNITTSGGNSWSSDYRQYLKRIFLKSIEEDSYVEIGALGWDYTIDSPNPDKITQCSNNQRPAYPNDFCSVYPKVLGVTLTDPELVEVTYNNGYEIKSAGYYNINFGVSVDSNQAPIKLVVDFGDGSAPMTTGLIDPNTNFNFVHRYTPPANGVKYKIRIKVTDNWDMYNCYGLDTFDKNCERCCVVNNFVDTLSSKYCSLCK